MSLSSLLRTFVDGLLWPVILVLGLAAILAVMDVGVMLGERLFGLRALRRGGDVARIDALARRRIERSDVLARVGPMLGLMGTLIPLGPGLAALGRGDAGRLADAVIVAFDTTVVGLMIGVLAYGTGRVRRRWYGVLLDALESREVDALESTDA